MKHIKIIFKNGSQVEFDYDNEFDLHRINNDSPIIFDNMYINLKEVLIIEVKEI